MTNPWPAYDKLGRIGAEVPTNQTAAAYTKREVFEALDSLVYLYALHSMFLIIAVHKKYVYVPVPDLPSSLWSTVDDHMAEQSGQCTKPNISGFSGCNIFISNTL